MKFNRSGFTLVELMVVVAIIGILSAVAVPNFKKFKEKSKMAQGRTGLSALYTEAANFQLDNDTYLPTVAGVFSGFTVPSTSNFKFSYPVQVVWGGGSGTLASAAASTANFTATAAALVSNANCQLQITEDKSLTVAGGASDTCK